MKMLQISFNVIGFLFFGLASFTYLFVSLGEFNIRGGWEYSVYANFSNASGLRYIGTEQGNNHVFGRRCLGAEAATS